MIDIRKERPLSIRRAAEFMDVSSRTIERWFTEGLERAKAGGKVYTTRSALQAFLKRDETPDPSQREMDAQLRRSEAYLDSVGV